MRTLPVTFCCIHHHLGSGGGPSAPFTIRDSYHCWRPCISIAHGPLRPHEVLPNFIGTLFVERLGHCKVSNTVQILWSCARKILPRSSP